MATFVISTVCSGGYFGCMINTIKESCPNPEDINLYANKSVLAYSAKTKISKNIYSDSILRSIDNYSSFASDANRFCVEYGVYVALKFVESKMQYGDSVVIAGCPYVKPLARGILETIEDWLKQGKILVMATQVQQEGSDMSIYHVALRTKEKLSFLEAFDMNLPSVLTKMMWILSITNDSSKIKELFYTTINHDILYKGKE
jgi:hypothetical protein